MLSTLVSLTRKFISIPSTSGNALALKAVLELALSHLRGYTIERFVKQGVESALIYRASVRPRQFSVVLNAHLDVLPGKQRQYRPMIRAGRLLGAGAVDMKAGAVCLIMAFRAVADRVAYPLALQLVTDEEVGGTNGTRYQVDRGVRAAFVLAGEPTNFDIVNEAKGVLWATVTAPGRTAHGAYPWQGDNAVWKMHNFLAAVRRAYPVPSQEKWATTVNVSWMRTDNETFNKVPEACTVGLDMRLVPAEVSEALALLRSLLPAGFALDVRAQEPALKTSGRNAYVRRLRAVAERCLKGPVRLRGAHGTSDARHYASVRGVGVEFGPIGGGIGSDDEWVNISSLETYYRMLTTFLLRVA